MEIATCAHCGRLFQKVSRELCPACLKAEEEVFEKIKVYLRRNPGATIAEVTEDLGIPEDQVIHFLQDGRLIASENMHYSCEKCGKEIQRGHLCDTCRETLQHSVSEIAKGLEQHKNDDKPLGYYHSKRRGDF